MHKARTFFVLYIFPCNKLRGVKETQMKLNLANSPPKRFLYLPVSRAGKMGDFYLDLDVNMGYVRSMFRSIVFFALRLSLIATTFALVWRFVEPKTQLMRILRAALLVLGLLGVLAAVRVTGP